MARVKVKTLATTLRKLGVTSSDLKDVADVKRAAKVARDGDEKGAAKELLATAEDASKLAKLRVLVGDAGVSTAKPASTRSAKLPVSMPCRSEEAARAAAIYLPNMKSVPRPLERFLVHVARLHDDLASDK